MARSRPKADHRAETRGSPWAGIPHCVIDSLAFRHLSLWGRAVLVEIVRQMNGYNNGEIAVSQRQLAARLNTTNFRKIGWAVGELMSHGFVDVAVEGQWKQRMARQYPLTFVNTGKPGHYRPGTNEYLHWTPPKKLSVETASAELGASADIVSAARARADETGSARSTFLRERPF